MPQSVAFSSSQKRDSVEYWRSRQPSVVATETTRVAGIAPSTGGCVLASTGGATGTDTEGSVCCCDQRS
ncbi:hypothetical protein FQZ97_1276210 [compost metagenome]